MKKFYIITLLLLLGIIFFISFSFINNKKIFFTLKGNSNLELNIGEEYEELGYNANYCNKYLKIFCKDLKNYVEISKREIDENKYVINYILNYDNKTKILTRKINYIDKESPIIKLEENELSYCPNNKNIEIKYSAVDNIDGDITDKVTTEIKNNKIYYSVIDSSGNKKVIFRDINYKDEESPIVTLNGSEVSYVFLNQKYNDKGVTATDNCDLDVNKKIKIDSNLDTTIPGEYKVSYIVSDSFNNITTVDRKVIVYNDISNVPKNGKIVYLTFDDGPASYTEEILNILDKYNVKATFFVTNQFSSYQNLIKKEYDKGHSIAVHTYSHNYKQIYSSLENYLSDFYNINQIIYEQTGEYSKIFRFPGGSSNTISKFNRGIMTELVNKTKELGYYYFDWNVDSMDTSEKDPNKIFENIKKGIEKNEYSVVLMHDIKKANIESVDKILSYGLENGYTFLPLDETSPLVQHTVLN